MKFFWKIFFAFTALITVVFSVFGIWMITQSFNRALEKEIEEADRENRMFQFAFEVNMNTLSQNYRTEKIVADLAESVVGNLDMANYSYRVYRGSGTLLYESGGVFLQHGLMDKLGQNACVYQVLKSGDGRYLVFLCRSEAAGRTYYLESIRDITALYEERDDFYGQYRIIMAALIAATGTIVFIVSHFLTKSIVDLSDTTKQFAGGNYDVRADDVREDEIGTLAQDFNLMADNLANKMEELTDAARKQEDFTASFAHELKTPLTSIIGYADMLRTMDMTQEETMEAASYIYTQGKRLESLSFKLLELIVTQNQKPQMRPVLVQELMREVEQVSGKSLEAKKIILAVNVEEGSITGEKDLLLSLFVNLIDNARKALKEGGIIRIEGKRLENGYSVSVCDNGCGMPKEEIEKITEAFYMVDKSRSRREGGAGLGMTLCSRIVEVHGASWQITSELGEGTEITVFFPESEVPHEED